MVCIWNRAGITLVLIVVGACSTRAIAQSRSVATMAKGYYVVVAAFGRSKEDCARRYVSQLTANGNAASYGFDEARNLYLVYLQYFPAYDPSIADMRATRDKGVFTDAWVRVIRSGEPVEQPVAAVKPVVPADKVRTVEEKVSGEPPSVEDSSVMDVATASAVEPDEESSMDSAVMYAPEPSTPRVVIRLINAAKGESLEGDVEVIDTDRSRLIERVEANVPQTLPDPKSESGKLSLISDLFGYRKMQLELASYMPERDAATEFVAWQDSVYVVDFDLVRYRKGDIATLYNVYFFNDAAVMRPESKYELGSLLTMMRENPVYQIRLHGHSNGNYRGKIITPGDDLFSLEQGHEGQGSAKTLSRERAGVIRDYLVQEGIDEARIAIKAWGGKRPLYDKNGANAQRNVRVEVEILED